MPAIISDIPRYYDEKGYLITDVNVSSKVHPQAMRKLSQKAGSQDVAAIQAYVEELIDNEL